MPPDTQNHFLLKACKSMVVKQNVHTKQDEFFCKKGAKGPLHQQHVHPRSPCLQHEESSFL